MKDAKKCVNGKKMPEPPQTLLMSFHVGTVHVCMYDPTALLANTAHANRFMSQTLAMTD